SDGPDNYQHLYIYGNSSHQRPDKYMLLGDQIKPSQRLKEFRCETCMKTFTLKNNLHQHMKIHTGVKRHVCPVCSRGFQRSTHLKGHLLRVHPEFNSEGHCQRPLDS
ncbi:unnamed protein product, partial [Owenia fusiformis]